MVLTGYSEEQKTKGLFNNFLFFQLCRQQLSLFCRDSWRLTWVLSIKLIISLPSAANSF